MTDLDIPALRQALAIVRRETRNLHVMTVVLGCERLLEERALKRVVAPVWAGPVSTADANTDANTDANSASMAANSPPAANAVSRAANGHGGDRKAYQRELMRQRRAAAKAAKGA